MPLKESAACFQLFLNDAGILPKKTQKHLSSPQSPSIKKFIFQFHSLHI